MDKLSAEQRREIAAGLFAVDSKAGSEKKGELMGLCPLHQEKTPSFSYNYEKDVYFCFGCRASGDLIKLWCQVNGKDPESGFRAFCSHYGIALVGGGNSPGAPRSGRRRRKQQDDAPALDEVFGSLGDLPESWVVRLVQARGWSKDMISRIGIRLQTKYQAKKTGEIKPVRNPNRIAIPVRDLDGKVKNIRLYQPFRDPNSGKDSAGQEKIGPAGGREMPKIISWGEAYGAARLFPARPGAFFDKKAEIPHNPPFRKGEEEKAPPGINPDPTGGNDPAERVYDGCGFVDEDPVLLCEGESDCICALSRGFNAITQTSKPRVWSRDQAEVFAGRDVVIAFDADQPGQKYAHEFAAPVLAKVARSVKILEWPDFMGRSADGSWPENHGQDLTDFFVKHRKTADDLWDLIDAADPFDPLPGMTSAAMAFFERGINDRLSFKPRLLAERILKDMKLLSDPETGVIYKWNGRYWEEFHKNHIHEYALHLLGIEAQRSRAEDATFQVACLSTIPHHRKVNDRIDYVCLKNGMLNLNTFNLEPHHPDFFSTHEIPVRWNENPAKKPDRFLQFLDETIQTSEVIDQIQEFFGYCFIRETTYDKCLLLLGPGEDGKSRLIKILRELVGPQNCSAVSFEGLQDKFERSSLYLKLVNISTEMGQKAFESDFFKAICTGDPISAQFKYKDNFEFCPYAKLVFSGNKLPKVLDNTHGFFRRLLPISFKRQFLEGDPARDPHLHDKLMSELSEIFAWSMIGLDRLRRNGGFTNSDETRETLYGYHRLNNPVICFVEDACTLDEAAVVGKVELYKAYRGYCSENGYQPFSRENFFRELYSAKTQLKNTRVSQNGDRVRMVSGIELKTDGENG